MNIAKISVGATESYIPRDVKIESTKQNELKTEQSQGIQFNPWQQDILISAMDKLLNNIQLDNSHPLGRKENQPVESYQEALDVLAEIKSESLRNFGSQAQANVSAETFIQLMLEA